MKDGTASDTARSVAAHRLEYERAAADYGDPAADRSITVDVADGRELNRGRMHEYLRARTAFLRQASCAPGRGRPDDPAPRRLPRTVPSAHGAHPTP